MSQVDVLIWAHSDQQGGTEMPCLVAEALLRASPARPLSIALATPYRGYVTRFFPNLAVEVIETDRLLELEKYQDGSVNADATAELVVKRFSQLTFVWGHAGQLIKDRIKQGSIIISCGEPVALKVAHELDCPGLIVTDHLLTVSVREVLADAGLLNDVTAPIMTELEGWDRSAAGAYLSPLEFADPQYGSYLALGGMPATPISGLFYEPINLAELEKSQPYLDLKAQTAGTPVVCVFGGGGSVWDDITKNLHYRARGGELSDFALVIRQLENDVLVKGKWALYLPNCTKEVVLQDPGKMMYWYAACDLVVGRGGLVAQQVVATMISDLERSPEMLFIEEPGHPQIESERRELARLGLVHTRKLRSFQVDPFKVVTESLNRRDKKRRLLARARYSSRAMDSLAGAICNTYFT